MIAAVTAGALIGAGLFVLAAWAWLQPGLAQQIRRLDTAHHATTPGTPHGTARRTARPRARRLGRHQPSGWHGGAPRRRPPWRRGRVRWRGGCARTSVS